MDRSISKLTCWCLGKVDTFLRGRVAVPCRGSWAGVEASLLLALREGVVLLGTVVSLIEFELAGCNVAHFVQTRKTTVPRGGSVEALALHYQPSYLYFVALFAFAVATSAFVSLVVHPSEYKDVQDEKRAAYRYRHPQGSRVGALGESG